MAASLEVIHPSVFSCRRGNHAPSFHHHVGVAACFCRISSRGVEVGTVRSSCFLTTITTTITPITPIVAVLTSTPAPQPPRSFPPPHWDPLSDPAVPPPPPRNLKVFNATSSSLTAKWDPAPGPVQGYRLTYRPAGGGEPLTVRAGVVASTH